MTDSSPANLVHGAFGLLELVAVDAVSGFFGADTFAHELGDLVVRGTASRECSKVPFGRRKEAISQFTFRGNAQSVAVLAERQGHGVDKANASAAVGKLKIRS